MGWIKEVDVAYESIKTNDDPELPVTTDSNQDEKLPSKQLSGENCRKLKHYALYSVLIVFALIMQIKYLAYKFYIYYLHPDELMHRPWLVILQLCECMYLITATLTAVDHLLPPSSRPDLGLLDTGQRTTPIVDIFIPTCKEPTQVPAEAVKAALALDYPAGLVKVFVLDDGGDDDLRAFCDGLSVETPGRVVYIRREKPKGVPHHFKCGNMNNGLKYSEARYVVMMDADMILHPSYLRREILHPHIVSSSHVSFVQIPQAFYNLPMGDPLNDSCMMGYDRILANRDSLGTAPCVGTGALFRRKHLDEIGGFQPQSITEDTMTSFTLWNRGYESAYVNEKLQIGLTPWTFEGYIKQRQRWGKGAIQQYSASWRECLGRGSRLNFFQKIFHFYHTGYYFLSFVNMLLWGTLLGALALNWQLSVGTQTENLTIVKHFTLYLVSARVAWFALWLNMPQGVMMRNREESQFWWVSIYFMQMCLESLRDLKATFVFVPTSNIDKNAAKPEEDSWLPSWMTKCATQVNQVKWHLAIVATSMAVVVGRGSHALVTSDCDETFLVLGLSLFLVSVSMHMLVPVVFVFFPPNSKPSERKSLIRFNADGVPQFTPDDCVSKWSWSVVSYEMLSWITLIFWAAALVLVTLHPSGDVLHSWCKAGSHRTIHQGLVQTSDLSKEKSRTEIDYDEHHPLHWYISLSSGHWSEPAPSV